MNKKIGVFPGKFLPPHRGHLYSIISASTKVDKLYVVVSDNKQYTKDACEESNIDNMPLIQRSRWLAQETSGLDHIEVLSLDESDIPFYPNGAKEWTEKLSDIVPEKFHIIFGGEEEYRDIYMKHMPDIEYEVFDSNREMWPISATEIRDNPIKHWDYILGSVRPHFAKRILIAGTESCGKTTLTKNLAKIFHTSWSEEVGRYYADRFIGGNENLFVEEDFIKIAQQQREQDEHALKTANKIAFFDTDALITNYYAEVYLENKIPEVEKMINNSFYDYVFIMSPSVPWVSDGQRFLSDDKVRWEHYYKLIDMYRENNFKIILFEENSYQKRLEKAISIVNKIL